MTSQGHSFANLLICENGGPHHVAKIISDGGRGGKSRHKDVRGGQGDFLNVPMVFRQGLRAGIEAPAQGQHVEMICGYSFWESGQPAHW